MKDKTLNHILIQYPDEDLFEDGELSNDRVLTESISELEFKILQMWRHNKIVIAKWEKLNGRVD